MDMRAYARRSRNELTSEELEQIRARTTQEVIEAFKVQLSAMGFADKMDERVKDAIDADRDAGYRRALIKTRVTGDLDDKSVTITFMVDYDDWEREEKFSFTVKDENVPTLFTWGALTSKRDYGDYVGVQYWDSDFDQEISVFLDDIISDYLEDSNLEFEDMDRDDDNHSALWTEYVFGWD